MSGTQTIACSGDWSSGVIIDNVGESTDYDRLELSASETITAAAANAGIDITTDGSFTLETTEVFDIDVSGDDKHGIGFQNAVVSDEITLEILHKGNITTGGSNAHGINLFHKDGADDAATAHRDIIIDFEGDITTLGGGKSRGIDVEADYASVDIKSVGTINATAVGIRVIAVNAKGNVEVDHTGDITSQDVHGIRVQMTEGADLIVRNQGNINSGLNGINVETGGSVGGDIHVTQHGDILSSIRSIQALGRTGHDVYVNVVGNLVSQGIGGWDETIYAQTTNGGDVVINFAGSSRSLYYKAEELVEGVEAKNIVDGDGIFALADSPDFAGNSTVNFIGELTAGDKGIYAQVMNPGNTFIVRLGAVDLGQGLQHSTEVEGDILTGAKIRTGRSFDVYLDENDLNAGVNLGNNNPNGTSILEVYNQVVIGSTGPSDILGAYGNDNIVNHGGFTHTRKIDLARLGRVYSHDRQSNIFLVGLSHADREKIWAIEANGDGDYTGKITVTYDSDEVEIDLDQINASWWLKGLLRNVILAKGDTGINTIDNLEGAVFNSGTEIILKDPDYAETDGTFTNAGALSPGSTERTLLFEEVREEGTGHVLLEAVYTSGIQTTSLVGNFVQTETGKFLVNVDTQTGDSDKLEVTHGDVSLAGRLLFQPSEFVPNDANEYLILTYEQALIGRFGIPVFSDYEANYDTPGQVIATYREAPTFCEVAQSDNQRALACQGFANLADDNPILAELDKVLGQDNVRDIYGTLSGDLYPSLNGALMRDGSLRGDTVLQRLARLSSRKPSTTYGLFHNAQVADQTTKSAFDPNDWWMEAQGGFFDQDADAEIGTADMEHQSTGFLIGVDHSGGGGGEGAGNDSEGWAIGLAFGMVQGETDIDDRHASADTETWTLGMYGSARFDVSADLVAGLSYGLFGNVHTIESNRAVSFEDIDEHLTADYNATSFQAFAEINSRFEVMDDTVLRPFASLAHVSLATDGFTETAEPGSTAHTALTAQSTTQNLTTTTLGLRSEINIALPVGEATDRSIKLNGIVGWRHQFGDYEPGTEVAFAGSDPFKVTGAPLDEDSLVTGLTISAEIAPDLILNASHFGHLSENSEVHSFSIGLTARF